MASSAHPEFLVIKNSILDQDLIRCVCDKNVAVGVIITFGVFYKECHRRHRGIQSKSQYNNSNSLCQLRFQ